MDNAITQPAARPLGDIAVGAVQEAADRMGERLAPHLGKARKLQAMARDTVSNKPVAALAVSLGLGLLLGAVLARR